VHAELGDVRTNDERVCCKLTVSSRFYRAALTLTRARRTTCSRPIKSKQQSDADVRAIQYGRRKYDHHRRNESVNVRAVVPDGLDAVLTPNRNAQSILSRGGTYDPNAIDTDQIEVANARAAELTLNVALNAKQCSLQIETRCRYYRVETVFAARRRRIRVRWT